MVKDPRTPASTGGLLPLNLPQPAAVETGASGRPTAVLLRGVLRPVVAINDQWRIDDEWWRTEITRIYYAVELEGEVRLSIFRDQMTGAWFQQQYTPPTRLQAG